MGATVFEFVDNMDDPRIAANPNITWERFQPVDTNDPIRSLLLRIKDVAILDTADFPQYSFWVNRGVHTVIYSPHFKKYDASTVIVLRNRAFVDRYAASDVYSNTLFYGLILDNLLLKRDAIVTVQSMQNRDCAFITHHRVNRFVLDMMDKNIEGGVLHLHHTDIDDKVHSFLHSLLETLHSREIKRFFNSLPFEDLPRILQVLEAASNQIKIPKFLWGPLQNLSLEHNGFSEDDWNRLREKYR